MSEHNHSEPDAASWKTVWLGDPDNQAHATDGWLPVEAEVRLSQLAVFERKVTIGDASKDSDDYISSWIQGDWSGGLGVLDLSEGTDTSRYHWGCAETRFTNQTALPPMVTASRPSAAVGTCYPLGDVYDVDGTFEDRGSHPVQTFYCAFGPNPNQSNRYDVYGYNEGSGVWHARATLPTSGSLGGRLAGRPMEKGTPFRGYDALDTLLYVPMGGNGYATLKETTAGAATVQNSDTSNNKIPKPITMCVHDDKLWAMDNAGVLWKTADAVTWEQITDMSGAERLVFDRSRTPRKLINYINRAGEPVLCLVTDQDLWMLEEEASGVTPGGRWQVTAVQYPPHPDFGRAAAVWRPGEDLHIAAGMDTIRFTSANVIVPLSGPSRDDGVPRQYRGAIVDMTPELSCLYALVKGDSTAAKTQTFVEDGGISQDDQPYVPSNQTYNCVLAWTGTGWHAVWAPDYSVGDPTYLCVSKVPNGYRLWWGSTDGLAYTMRLRQTFHNPRAGIDPDANPPTGIDQYAETGFIETGRFDAVMRGFDKIASHFTIYLDYASPTETVTVDYQTEAAGWTTLGTFNTRGMTQVSFDPDGDGFAEGAPFNWIQFRMTLNRGSNTTLSPVIDAVVLHYVKIPQNTTSFVFTVPLPKRQWMGRSAKEINDHLTSLLESRKFIKLVHQDRSYRGKVAGISGADATGDDYSGGRTVNFIALGPNTPEQGS